jgi:MFS family permease
MHAIGGKRPVEEDPTQTTLAPVDGEPSSSGEDHPEYQGFTKREIHRNMIFCVMMDAIFMMGWADTQMALQPLLVYLGASNTTIGVITGLNWAGFFGIFLSPFITRRFPYKKRYFFGVNMPYLAPLALAGVGVLLGHGLGWSHSTMITFLICVFVAHHLFGGFVSLPHTEYIAACIPMAFRARLTGLSFGVGSGLGLISAAIGRYILTHVAKPQAYGYLLLMTWIIIQSGYLLALFAKEKRTPVEKSPHAWSRSMLKAFWDDKPFVNFVILTSIATICMGSNVVGFFNVYGLKVVKMPDNTVPIMVSITLFVRFFCAAPLGWLTDWIGAKRLMPLWSLAGGLAFLPAILMPIAGFSIKTQIAIFGLALPHVIHVPASLGVYVSIGLGIFYLAGFNSAASVLGYGLPKPENRGGHFTLQIVFGVACLSAAAMLTGKLADMFSYRTVFLAILVIGIIMYPVSLYMMRIMPDKASDYS